LRCARQDRRSSARHRVRRHHDAAAGRLPDLLAHQTQQGVPLHTRDHVVFQGRPVRSEEHTSELQSLAYLVCRLLLEKKNKTSPYRGASSASAGFATVTRANTAGKTPRSSSSACWTYTYPSSSLRSAYSSSSRASWCS